MGKIKQLSLENYDEISKLSQFAFQYTLNSEQVSKKREEAMRHKIFGYMIDNKMAAKLHIIPLNIVINKSLFKMGGISSVATWPEYRKRGIAKKLMYHSLQEMKKMGLSISFLHPFHFGFYRNYGWELGFVNQKLTIPIENFQYEWLGKGKVRRDLNNLDLLQEIYTKFAHNYNGMLIRDKKWWKQRVLTDDEVQIAIAYDDNEAAVGYIIYKVRDDVFITQEMAYESINGRNLIYNFIKNHDSMIKKIKITVSENDMLPYYLNYPYYKQEMEPYFMARIVDVYEFLKNYPFNKVEEEINLCVEDEFYEENSSCYRITLQHGEVDIIKTNEIKGINCSIQQLTSICLGFKRPKNLYDNQLIFGDEKEIKKLENLIPRNETNFTDFF